jgi:hypothetical protein
MEYFKQYIGKEKSSLVNALAEMGEQTSYNYRAQIAQANNIESYSGTAEQNLTMLGLLKIGQLIKPGGEILTPSDTTATPPRRRWIMGGLALAGIALAGKVFGKQTPKSKAIAKSRKKRSKKKKK